MSDTPGGQADEQLKQGLVCEVRRPRDFLFNGIMLVITLLDIDIVHMLW